MSSSRVGSFILFCGFIILFVLDVIILTLLEVINAPFTSHFTFVFSGVTRNASFSISAGNPDTCLAYSSHPIFFDRNYSVMSLHCT